MKHLQTFEKWERSLVNASPILRDANKKSGVFDDGDADVDPYTDREIREKQEKQYVELSKIKDIFAASGYTDTNIEELGDGSHDLALVFEYEDELLYCDEFYNDRTFAIYYYGTRDFIDFKIPFTEDYTNHVRPNVNKFKQFDSSLKNVNNDEEEGRYDNDYPPLGYEYLGVEEKMKNEE